MLASQTHSKKKQSSFASTQDKLAIHQTRSISDANKATKPFEEEVKFHPRTAKQMKESVVFQDASDDASNYSRSACMASLPRALGDQIKIEEPIHLRGDESIPEMTPCFLDGAMPQTRPNTDKQTLCESKSRADELKSRSDFSLSEKGFSDLSRKDLVHQKRRFILFWVWAFFIGTFFGILLMLSVFTSWRVLPRFLLMGILGGEIFIGASLWLIHRRNKKQYLIYAVSAVLFALACGKTIMELEQSDVLLAGDEESFLFIFTLYFPSLPPLLSVMIISGIFIGLEIIETQRMRKQFFAFFTILLLSQLILPNFRLYSSFEDSSRSHILSASISLVSGSCAIFMIYLLFRLKTLSFQVFLHERDDANRYKYMFNSIKDLIIVESQGKLLYRNKTASKVFKVLESEQRNQITVKASILDLQKFFLYQNYQEENTPRDFWKGRCYSMRELLKMDKKKVAAAIFTTSKEIGEANSLDLLQQTLDKLNDDRPPIIPLFVNIRLIKVVKEVLEDIYEEGDEVMIQIQDVSHRILGQNLKIERQYMAIMNSTVSHEMRNPLNALLSSVEIQQKRVSELTSYLEQKCLAEECEPTTASFAKSLSVSRSSCKLLKFNVEDILALPQIQQGKFTKNVSHHNLHRSVDEILEIMEYQVREKKIDVTVEYSKVPSSDLVLDEQRFQQIFLNFFSNAIKFTRKEGRITILLSLKSGGSTPASVPFCLKKSTVPRELKKQVQHQLARLTQTRDSDQLTLAVIDNGTGISRTDQTKLFKLFGCLQSTRKVNTKGVGLGLAISKMIAEEFEGQVAVQSELGVGSAFFCSLAVNKWFEGVASKQTQIQLELSQKLSQVKDTQAREAASKLNAMREGGEIAVGKRILVVDDEAYNCEILAAIIQAMGVERKRIDLCLSGEEALEHVRAGTAGVSCCYGAILTDLSMPFIDGYQFSRKVRQFLSSEGLTTSSQPLIAAITGHTECEFYTSAFESGIDQVYSKPISSSSISLLLTQVGFKVKLSEEILNRLS